jgi:hypothetical protein
MTVSASNLRWSHFSVLEQFLFDHGDKAAFVYDYGSIDLRDVTWQIETIPAADFSGMPTGASDAGYIELRREPGALGHGSAPRRSAGTGKSTGHGCARRS